MNYKGKRVSLHRHKQLVKTRENIRKRRNDTGLLLHPESLKRLKELLMEE